MIEKVKIYLAGTIYDSPPDCNWKQKLVNELNRFETLYEYLDPQLSEETNNSMVTRDKWMINNCNIFVAYIQRPSFGTAMEIHYAFEKQHIPILIINPNGLYEKDLWLRYHRHEYFRSISDCSSFIGNEMIF